MLVPTASDVTSVLRPAWSDGGGRRARTRPKPRCSPCTCCGTDGLDPDLDVTVRTFDVLAGKHGDHVGGEAERRPGPRRGQVDAACILEANLAAFERQPSWSPAASACWPAPRPSTTATSRWSHRRRRRSSTASWSCCSACPSTTTPSATCSSSKVCVSGLLARSERYRDLEEAVDQTGFDDLVGTITAPGYRDRRADPAVPATTPGSSPSHPRRRPTRRPASTRCRRCSSAACRPAVSATARRLNRSPALACAVQRLMIGLPGADAPHAADACHHSAVVQVLGPERAATELRTRCGSPWRPRTTAGGPPRGSRRRARPPPAVGAPSSDRGP